MYMYELKHCHEIDRLKYHYANSIIFSKTHVCFDTYLHILMHAYITMCSQFTYVWNGIYERKTGLDMT